MYYKISKFVSINYKAQFNLEQICQQYNFQHNNTVVLFVIEIVYPNNTISALIA